MKFYLENLSQYENIILFDIEYDQNSLVQIALLILGVVEPNIFELQKSINIYVKQNRSLNSFFIKYTNITNEFLCDNGVDLTVARALVNEVLLDVDSDKTLLVSHGIKSDIDLLENRFNNIHLSRIKNKYCTYLNAKRLLKREDRLTLKDVAAEGCYYMYNAHNAYADVWGTLYAFGYLNRLEKKNG